jgi:hypothetical protein
MTRDPCNRLVAGKLQVHMQLWDRVLFRSHLHMRCGSREQTYIERLNSAVPDNIRAQSGRRPTDNHVIVYRDALGPQHLPLLRVLGSVVLERNGRGMPVVRRVRAHAAGMPLMALPVRRDYAAPLGSSSGNFGPITSRRRSAVGGVRLKARRLHPFTVACWAGGASDKGTAGWLPDNCAEVRGKKGSR